MMIRKELIFLTLVLILIPVACTEKQPVDYVNPFTGTGFHGHTYPGATIPFGAVQLSPDTRRGNWDACSGYHYSDTSIAGFSHTHLSGTGCIDLGDILVHPTSKPLHLQGDDAVYDPVSFSHSQEKASPGYYSVRLDDGIFAELTATKHCGVHRYSFPGEGDPTLVIDLAHLLDNESIDEASLVYNGSELSGMRKTTGWVAGQYIYFVARVSSFVRVDLISSGESHIPSVPLNGKNLQAVMSFPGSQGKSVTLFVGLSSVSIENARENLEKETGSLNFDQLREKARETWNNALEIYKLQGKKEDLENFYTAAYHTMLTPNLMSDVNGEYRGADMKIHKSERDVYSTFSLWDTFRAWNPLMTLTDTTLVNNMINSYLNFYDQTGQLPLWPLSSGETGTMIGYHSVSVIRDAYSKNIRGFDRVKAYQAMKSAAEFNTKGTTPFEHTGYIPSDTRKESVSSLLENSYDDWCIAEMAKDLGYKSDYERFIRRAAFYKNVFDGSTGFFRGRNRDGIWDTPFDPFEVGRVYTEATAWQYRFFVPHDIYGLMQLMGGRKQFVAALDSLYAVTSETAGNQSDISGLIGQYAHGNEPSHHIAYLWSFAGEPWKTQSAVRRILHEMYSPSPEGISGNEDCGQMSAWYILSSLGLYQVCPGSGQFVLTSPLFPKAVIRLAGGKILEITANDPADNMYIKSVIFNGKPIEENYLTYDMLMKGGHLEFKLAPLPDTSRGSSEPSFPYSMSVLPEVSVPFVKNDISFFNDSVMVICGSRTENAEIHYTVDGTEPDVSSKLYTRPFKIDHSAVITLEGFRDGYKSSPAARYLASKVDMKKAVNPVNPVHGLKYDYFEGKFSFVSEFKSKGLKKASGITDSISLAMALQPDHFAFEFSGYIDVPVDGVYTFSSTSDDGSCLLIDGVTVVNNDGSHSALRASGRIALSKGYHRFCLDYFEDYEGESLSAAWIIPGTEREEIIKPGYLYRER